MNRPSYLDWLDDISIVERLLHEGNEFQKSEIVKLNNYGYNSILIKEKNLSIDREISRIDCLEHLDILFDRYFRYSDEEIIGNIISHGYDSHAEVILSDLYKTTNRMILVKYGDVKYLEILSSDTSIKVLKEVLKRDIDKYTDKILKLRNNLSLEGTIIEIGNEKYLKHLVHNGRYGTRVKLLDSGNLGIIEMLTRDRNEWISNKAKEILFESNLKLIN